MSEILNEFKDSMEKSQEQAPEMLDRILAAAKPGAVFSEPVEFEGRKVITASEIFSGGFFGYGAGYGSAGDETTEEAEEEPRKS